MAADRDFPNEPRPVAHAGAMPDPVFTCTQNARAQIALRALDPAWIKRTILAPDASETDPGHPDRTRAIRAVPEREGRLLRVVFVVRRPPPSLSTPLSSIVAEGPEPMKSRYDAEADALYGQLAEARVVGSEEVRPGIVLDLDDAGRVVGIEILDASRHVAEGAEFAHPVAA